MADIEALHLACAFDLKVPERRRAEVQQLISLINEQLWVGHFDLWPTRLVMFRHALVLAGGVEPSEQAMRGPARRRARFLRALFPAFQFVVWAGKSAQRSPRRRRCSRPPARPEASRSHFRMRRTIEYPE